MADRFFYWQGKGAGTKTDWNDGRNWVDGASSPYAQGDYPGSSATDTDYAYFISPIDLEGGAASPETNLDLSAANPISALTVRNAYNGHIGKAAAYLKAEISNVVIDAGGADDALYIQGIGTNGLQSVRCLGGTVHFGGKLGLEALKGTIDIANGSTITSLLITYLTSTADVILTIGSGCTLPAIIEMTAGSVSCNSAVTTLNIRSGTWTQNANATTVSLSGGTFVWAGGNITTANVYSGTLSSIGYSTSRAVTIAILYPAGTLNLNSSGVAISSYVQIYGGTLVLPAGTKIQTV